MLLIKDGCLHIAGVSFALPDGLYLNTAPATQYDHGIELVSANGSISIILTADRSEIGAEAELNNVVCNDGIPFTVIRDIASIALNGLCGFDCLYKNHSQQFYEAQFDLPENEEGINVFSICVWTKAEIKSALDVLEVKNCINEIRKEPKEQ